MSRRVGKRNETGIAKLKFTFDRPLPDPSYHFYLGSRVPFAYPAVFASTEKQPTGRLANQSPRPAVPPTRVGQVAAPPPAPMPMPMPTPVAAAAKPQSDAKKTRMIFEDKKSPVAGWLSRV